MPDSLLKREPPRTHLQFETQGSLFVYITLTLFFLATALFGGLYLINQNLEKTQETLLQQIQGKQEELRPGILNQITTIESSLNTLRRIVTDHRFPTNIFLLLEKDTHPQVRFSSFTYLADSRKVDLGGEAANYAALAEQIGIFEQEPQIEQVEFGGLSTTQENFVGFKITLTPKQSLLALQP